MQIPHKTSDTLLLLYHHDVSCESINGAYIYTARLPVSHKYTDMFPLGEQKAYMKLVYKIGTRLGFVHFLSFKT